MNSPKHVAIIMDGNGRWGIKRKKSRNYGHTKGVEVVETIISEAISQNIKYLTLYTFSTENWKRPKSEINFLLKLLEKYISKELNKLIRKNIKLKIIGNINKFPKLLKLKLIESERLTKFNNKIQINIALNYGSKIELINAFKNLNKNNDKINEKNLTKYLLTKNIPDPDLLIRTGNTKRLSNFFLWQLAYTEIFFEKKLWPDFNVNDYNKIIKKFKNIKRNFGKI